MENIKIGRKKGAGYFVLFSGEREKLRPARPTWNGEGRPPVGTVCEYQTTSWPAEQWEVREIRYISDYHVVTAEEDGVERSVCAEIARFRPIRTPEQIAAEERVKACQQWLDNIATAYGADVADKCEDILMDAEKRKQVKP